MARTKRLFYVPGLISLIGLCVALPPFFRKSIPVRKYCLELFVPSDFKRHDLHPYETSKYYLEDILNKKRKIKFELNEGHDENKKKMQVIRYEALKLKYTVDTSTVILVTLSDGSFYGEFVVLVDMCDADRHKRYACWDNKFVIFGEPPPKRVTENVITPIYCGTAALNKKIKKTSSEKKSNQFSEYYSKKGLVLIIGWLTLLLSYFYFRKRV